MASLSAAAVTAAPTSVSLLRCDFLQKAKCGCPPAFAVAPSPSFRRPSLSTAVRALFGGGAKAKQAKANCAKCKGKGGIECPSCKGTGKSKSNGNMFERWKCYKCQGFGLVGCPSCGTGGLTPEQRGER